MTQHTSSGTSDEAELHMIRAVNTGIINVGSHFLCDIPSFPDQHVAFFGGPGIRREDIERAAENATQETKTR